MRNCPACGEAWNEETCGTCGWNEAKVATLSRSHPQYRSETVRAVPTILAEARSAAREGSASKAPTPYAVRCPTHGLTYLTAAEYDRQMRACDDVWVCPICDTRSIWDDATYEAAMDDEESRLSRYVAPAEVHSITDPIDDGDDR